MEFNNEALQRAARAMAQALRSVPGTTSVTLTCRFTDFSATRQAVSHTADGTAVHPSLENITWRLLVEEAMEALQPAGPDDAWTIDLTVREDDTWDAEVESASDSHAFSGTVI